MSLLHVKPTALHQHRAAGQRARQPSSPRCPITVADGKCGISSYGSDRVLQRSANWPRPDPQHDRHAGRAAAEALAYDAGGLVDHRR